MNKIFLAIILSLVPAVVLADASGKRKLLQVEVTDTFFTIYSAEGDFDKETCDIGNPIAFQRADFPSGYDSMLSIALSAHISGKQVEMWFSGCQASPWGGTMPKPTSIVLK